VVLDVAWLRYHVVAMAAGQCLTAFFAVWTVHHPCEAARGPIARTIRGSRSDGCFDVVLCRQVLD
jgi:hypothetical protein